MAGDSSNGWSDRAELWAEHWTRLSAPARTAVADAVGIEPGTRLLDAGCGSGEFLALAARRGAVVSGIDAAEGMLALARRKVPGADLRHGDLLRLPYDDDAFEVATAFNAVQFAGDVARAVAELARVAGRVAICNWAEHSELYALFEVLTEPAPAGVRAPGVLEDLMSAAGLRPELSADVATPYRTPDLAALVAALREGSGLEVTEDQVAAVASPYRRADGSYRFENRFRYVIATRG